MHHYHQVNAKIDQCFIFFIWKLYTFAPRKLNATSLKVRVKAEKFSRFRIYYWHF